MSCRPPDLAKPIFPAVEVDVDDFAALARLHDGKRRLHEMHGTVKIDLHHSVEISHGGVP
jgi:hypothetical protein